jgi:hypothetical protein
MLNRESRRILYHQMSALTCLGEADHHYRNQSEMKKTDNQIQTPKK